MGNELEEPLLPSGWKVSRLDEVTKRGQYSFTGGPFGSNLKAESYTSSGVRIIQLQNIGDGFFNDSYKIYTSVEKADELLSCNIYPGDIIVSKMGDPVARAAIIPNGETRYLMSSDGIRLEIDKKRFDTKFVLEAINSFEFRKKAIRHSVGSTRQRISLNDLRSLTVMSPPLPEQRKIAEILGTWDEAIRLTADLIAAKQQRKKGLMQRLLSGEVRFPGFAGRPWVNATLGDVAQIIMGQSPSSRNYNKEGRGLALIQGNADIIDRRTTPRNFTTEITKESFPGDIILSVRAPVGETALSDHHACIGRGVCAIRAERINKRFLFQLLVSIEQTWQTYAQGSTFTAINSSDIKQLLLCIPSDTEEQRKIASILHACDHEIDLLQQKHAALQQQKKGLMQRLLTGQVRVRG